MAMPLGHELAITGQSKAVRLLLDKTLFSYLLISVYYKSIDASAMNVTIKQLQAFLAVAELGNFTRAAERLRVAQPALSQHVRELETELALRLFDRTTRRVELTAGGREFRSAATKILAELEHAVRNAHDLAEHKRGRITIAAPPLLAAVILPRAIAEFHARNSGVQIVLVEHKAQLVQLIFGGLVSSTLLDTLLTPLMFWLWGRAPLERLLAAQSTADNSAPLNTKHAF